METARPGILSSSPTEAPQIDSERCSACGRCVSACTERLTTLDPIGFRKISSIRFPDRCTRCGRCIDSCPVGAIS